MQSDDLFHCTGHAAAVISEFFGLWEELLQQRFVVSWFFYSDDGTSGCASTRPARWQRGGLRVQRRTLAAARVEARTGGSRATTPLCAHANRSFDVSRWRVEKVALEAKSCEKSRSATVFITPLLGTFLKYGKERALHLVEDVENAGALVDSRNGFSASPWFTGCCCSDGSLAVIQPLWLQETSEDSSLLENLPTAHAGACPTMPAPV